MKNDPMRTDEKADFWDISALVPPRKSGYQRRETPDVSAAEVISPPRSVASSQQEEGHAFTTYYVSRTHEADERKRETPEYAYQPSGSLLLAVRVYPHKHRESYYEQFCRQAKALHAQEGTPCEAVPFFSYVPQYGQMSRAQLGFYLWWRTSFRRGEMIDVDYSYLLLYLYEIINLGDVINPQTGQKNMLRLWLYYRKRHRGLDALVREWLCDYSLLYRLPPPVLPPESLRDMITGARLREFYVGAAEGDAMCEAMLWFCSNYDYKKSKFYQGDAMPLYDHILAGAVRVALDHMQEKRGENATREGGFSTITRDAFAGALCAHRYKKRIEVDFSSFSHTYEMRYVITDVLKYAENALRAALGIKSRLSVYDVSAELRAKLDVYLANALPQKNVKKRTISPPMPEYERRYDLPATPISPENAARIESASWETTKRLIEAFGDVSVEREGQRDVEIPVPDAKKTAPLADISAAAIPVLPLVPAQPQQEFEKTSASLQAEQAPATVAKTPWHAALGDLIAFLPLCLGGGRDAQRDFARRHGMMLDLIADKINTVAGDILGDIVLEDTGGYYEILEDYRPYLQEEGVL